MYSVVVHTTDSTADYGTNITTTEKLKQFLCALDMQLVTHMEINYYRELTNAELPKLTGEPNLDIPTIAVVEPANAPQQTSNWEPDNMGLPL